MFKYIKWELRDEFHKKFILLLIIAAVFILAKVVPMDSKLFGYLLIPYIFIILGALLFSYYYGAKRTLESYENKTFLLESMIPFSPYKILLAKYILAIFFDLVASIILVIGLSIIIQKVAEIKLIDEIFKLIFNLNISKKTILKFFVFIVSSTIAFTSLVTCIFLVLKSYFPKGRRHKLFSFVIATLILNTLVNNFLNEFLGESSIASSLALFGLTVACYFVSVIFIKEKLEVY